MSMNIRPASADTLRLVNLAGHSLLAARDYAVRAGCPQLAKKIRSAIASHGGAVRHMHHRLRRTTETK